MKKPLLTGKEYDGLKEFLEENNLSLLPKQIPINISIEPINDKSVERTRVALEDKLTAQLKEFKVLNKDPLRPVYYYDFEVDNGTKEEFKYAPGDSFGFSPKLSHEEVEALFSWVNLNDLVKITGPKDLLSLFFPSHDISTSNSDRGELIVEIEDILSRIDLRSVPKKAVLRSLAEYCSDEGDSNLLLFLSSRKGSEAYNRLCANEMLSGRLILAAVDSLKLVPIEVLASLFGPLQARYYSCCRPQNPLSPLSFQIVFNVSEGQGGESNFKIKGVCSSWLEDLTKSMTVPVKIPIQKRSINHFKLAETISPSIPLIFIACGTGISPFIGFLELISQQQQQQQQQQQKNEAFNWLIFGLRWCKTDFIFQEEIESFLQNGTLSKLSLAQSRNPDEPKTYAQDLIKREKDQFYELITEKDAKIYVCGDELTMIKGVNEVILEILMEKQVNLTRREAEGIILEWTKEKKIIRDIWV